ncbi:S-adenosyl-l-methionine hydroxide adenosyltransferase family protein [Candidatus Aenigmatarchaeota archaeon]
MDKIITLTTDFGIQSQGIGNMEGIIYKINPKAKVIHLMHGLPSFDLFMAARTMETVFYMPPGYHVCVVDPGVGTKRKGIIVETKRGDCFIGPDNGCLMTAPRLLGGIKKIVEITNKKYMIEPVSPIFHGRHVFSPAAAYLSKGVKIEEFGKEINSKKCVVAPYDEATFTNKKTAATIISINKFGSFHLNILSTEWDKMGVKKGDKFELTINRRTVKIPFSDTFGDVGRGKPLIMKDDYARTEVALNLGRFVDNYPATPGDKVIIRKV